MNRIKGFGIRIVTHDSEGVRRFLELAGGDSCLEEFCHNFGISDEGGGRNRCFGLSAGSLHITSSIMKSVSTSSITIATA
jgi:hypothetical protein